MWQSCVHVEIEVYSVTYFDHTAAFEAPYRWTSIKGWGAHTCFIDAWISNKLMKCIWAPPLMEVQQYAISNMAQNDQNTWRNNLRFLHRTVTYTDLGVGWNVCWAIQLFCTTFRLAIKKMWFIGCLSLHLKSSFITPFFTFCQREPGNKAKSNCLP